MDIQQDHDLQLYIKRKQDAFEYAFTTLIFTSLALSLQFSPPMGKHVPEILIASWILLFLSAIAGGYRLMHSPQFDKIARGKLILNNFISKRKTELNTTEFIESVQSGLAIDPKTGTSQKLEDLQKGLSGKESKLEIAKKNLKHLQCKMSMAHYIKLWLFLLGIFLNGLFVAVNYLNSSLSCH